MGEWVSGGKIGIIREQIELPDREKRGYGTSDCQNTRLFFSVLHVVYRDISYTAWGTVIAVIPGRRSLSSSSSSLRVNGAVENDDGTKTV